MDTEKHIKQTFCENAKISDSGKTDAKDLLAMGMDIDYFQAFLDDVDISDDQKIELIETLWQIVVNFVELGFQIHPLNHAQGSRAKDETSQALERVIGDFAADALSVLKDYEDDQIMSGLHDGSASSQAEFEDAPTNERSDM